MPIVCSTHQSSKGSPDEAKSWKEDTWPHTGENHIGGNLKDEIGDEEDQHDDGILARRKVEVLFQATSLRVSVYLIVSTFLLQKLATWIRSPNVGAVEIT